MEFRDFEGSCFGFKVRVWALRVFNFGFRAFIKVRSFRFGLDSLEFGVKSLVKVRMLGWRPLGCGVL